MTCFELIYILILMFLFSLLFFHYPLCVLLQVLLCLAHSTVGVSAVSSSCEQIFEEVCSVCILLSLFTAYWFIYRWGATTSSRLVYGRRHRAGCWVNIFFKVFRLLFDCYLLFLGFLCLRCWYYLLIWSWYIHFQDEIFYQIRIVATERNEYSLFIYRFRPESKREVVCQTERILVNKV